ncbi:hypothetical protein [Streptomyces sp. NPDC018059]|uniref:hypothetical protein n=1 Tax=Streptomyces sp. NPDC018059 TaxID=3365041 RepID=UPI0037A1A47D
MAQETLRFDLSYRDAVRLGRLRLIQAQSSFTRARRQLLTEPVRTDKARFLLTEMRDALTGAHALLKYVRERHGGLLALDLLANFLYAQDVNWVAFRQDLPPDLHSVAEEITTAMEAIAEDVGDFTGSQRSRLLPEADQELGVPEGGSEDDPGSGLWEPPPSSANSLRRWSSGTDSVPDVTMPPLLPGLSDPSEHDEEG